MFSRCCTILVSLFIFLCMIKLSTLEISNDKGIPLSDESLSLSNENPSIRKPAQFKEVMISTRSIYMSWELPYFSLRMVLYFGQNIDDMGYIQLESNSRNHTIESLEPGSSYQIMIKIYYVSGEIYDLVKVVTTVPIFPIDFTGVMTAEVKFVYNNNYRRNTNEMSIALRRLLKDKLKQFNDISNIFIYSIKLLANDRYDVLCYMDFSQAKVAQQVFYKLRDSLDDIDINHLGFSFVVFPGCCSHVFHHPFDKNYIDTRVKKLLHLKIISDASFVPSKCGHALDISKSDITIKTHGQHALDSITLALYIKLNNLNGLHPIVSAVNYHTQMRLEVQEGRVVWMFYNLANSQGFIASTENVLKASQWMHILVDYNSVSGVGRIFLDGELQHKALSHVLLSSNWMLGLRVGKYFSGGVDYRMNGLIDNLLIFGCVMSLKNVQEISKSCGDFKCSTRKQTFQGPKVIESKDYLKEQESNLSIDQVTKETSDCNPAGTIGRYKHENVPGCTCKINVEGDTCGKCKFGNFNLNQENLFGCTPCFCNGLTKNCRGSQLNRKQIVLSAQDVKNLQVTTSDKSFVVPGEKLKFNPLTNSITYETNNQDTNKLLYWEMPLRYCGDKIGSYGGNLRFTISFLTRPLEKPLFGADVILKGNNIVLHYYEDRQPIPGEQHYYQIILSENFWRASNGDKVTREELITALAGIDSFLLRASFSTEMIESSLYEVRLDVIDYDNIASGNSIETSMVEECQCPPEYFGSSCQHCNKGYTKNNGSILLGTCVPCQCNNHAQDCDGETGQCRHCKHFTTGKNCEFCLPGYYGDPRSGRADACQPCPCPLTISSNKFSPTCIMGSDSEPVCNACLKGYTGRLCDRCAAGHTGDPTKPGDYCKVAQEAHCEGCDVTGSLKCNVDTGGCVCKKNVAGLKCSKCASNSFHLNKDNVLGCTQCWCSGVSQSCTSSKYYRTKLVIGRNDERFVVLTDIDQSVKITRGFYFNEPNELIFNSNKDIKNTLYWKLPQKFVGNKLTYYGGSIQYTVSFDNTKNGTPFLATDLILKRGNLKFIHETSHVFATRQVKNFEVVFKEDEWRHSNGDVITRDQFMYVLADIDSILLRAVYSTEMTFSSLSNLLIKDSAPYKTLSQKAEEVERCYCRRGYSGLSCERCSSGHKRATNSDGTEICVPCECNGHSEHCDGETGKCFHCQHNTTGDFCNYCTRGYYGDATLGGCHQCACPLTVATNQFSETCVLIRSDNSYECTSCKRGYTGKTCEQCDKGYAGNPTTPGGTCKQTVKKYTFAPVVDITPDRRQDRILTSAKFTCSARGESPLKLSWSRSDGRPFTDRVRMLNGENSKTLIINNLKMGDQETYICSARNDYGLNSARAVLIVIGHHLRRIRVSVTPRSLRIEEGAVARFVCTDDSETTSTLTWSRDGERLPDGAIVNGGFLSIPDVKKKHSGLYRCSGSNQYSSDVVSAMLTVGVVIKPVVSVTPTYQAINVGSSARFRCAATGYPRPSIEWKKGRSANLPPHMFVENFNLVVTDVREDDEGEYYCFATNKGGMTSSRVRLYVRGESTLPRASVPSPQMNARIGSTASIACSSGNSKSRVTFTWSRRNSVLPFKTEVKNGVLTIPDITYADEDVYKCVATNVYGSSSVTVKFVVTAESGNKPSIQLAPSLITLSEGATQYLECNVSGSPPPIVLWSKPNGLLTHRHIVEENKLFVVNATWEDSGLYTCTGKNKFGKRSATSVISVQRRVKPTIKIIGSINKTVYAGNRANFKCIVTSGIPTPNVYWRNQNGYRLSESYTKKTDDGVVLKFRKVLKSDEGEYTCEANNVVGLVSQKIVLKVKGDPQVYFRPRGLFDVSAGENVTLECFGKGYPVPVLAISHPKLQNLTSNYFFTERKSGYLKLVFIAQQSTGGIYTCTGVNLLGEKYDNVNVVVNSRELVPKPVVYPSKVQAKIGDEIKFYCGARGVPSPKIFWTKSNNVSIISTKGLLVFTSVKKSDEGIYHCNAKNRRGSAKAYAVLNVVASPYAEIFPRHLVVKNGHSFNMKCIVKGYPSPSITWHFNDVSNDPPSSVLVSQNEIISLGVSPEDAGLYICKARNVHGETIASAHISVVEPPNISPASDTVLYVSLQQNLTMRCNVDGYPRPHLRWKAPQKSSGYFKDNQYFLLNVTRYDQGQFICEASNSAGIAREIFTVIINELPKVSIEEDSTITLLSGNRKEIFCHAFGVPQPTVYWMKISDDVISRNVSQTNGTLIFDKVTSQDAGLYRCIAANKHGSVISEVKVYVFGLPVISIYPEHLARNINERAKFTCKIKNAEKARITWRRLNGKLPKEYYVKRDFLLLPKVSRGDAGKYVCRAENEEGSTEEVAQLEVLEFVPSFNGKNNSRLVMKKMTNILYKTNISISFKSSRPDGMLFYSGNPSKDFISITLHNSFVIFEYNLGSGLAFIRSRHKIYLEQWHTVEVLRGGAIGYIMLDNQEKSYGRSQGRFTGLNLEGELFLGGHENLLAIKKKSFTGCISQVIINSKKLDLAYGPLMAQNIIACQSCEKNPCQNFGKCRPISDVTGYRCICPKMFIGMNCEERVKRCYPKACKNNGRCHNKESNGFFCKCALGWSGAACEKGRRISMPSFNKNSLISYPVKAIQTGKLSLSITLKLNSLKNGSIASLNGSSDSFLTLLVVKSQIMLKFSLGIKPVVLKDTSKLNLNEWIDIHVELNGPHVSLTVNDNQAWKGMTDAFISTMSLSSDALIHIGHPNFSFQGCVRALKINSINIDLNLDYVMARKISSCFKYSVSPCASNPCLNDGNCKAVGKERYTCACKKWFTGKHCDIAIPRCGEHAQCINNGTCIERNGEKFCLCPLFYGGNTCNKKLVAKENLMLKEESYLAFPEETIRRKGVTRIGLSFKTIHNDSLLLWFGDHVTSSPDFLSLGITEGRLEIRYELGSGLAEGTSNIRVSDGSWHSIDLYRKGSTLICKLDRSNVFSITSPGTNKNLDVNSQLYIGGAENVAKTTRNKYKYGFVGCLKKFEVNGRLVNIMDRASYGFNIQPCNG